MDMNELISALGNSDVLNGIGTNELLGGMLKSGGTGNIALLVLIAILLFGQGGYGRGLGGRNQCCCCCSSKRHKHHHKRRCCC
ncbi:hypothetical protein BD780_000362 [Clostridium tetanomorphum]|uniref:Uncharacterized protein n=1 Tax=Clostridium tetanomorphum TaxID=1553 RepID=A0A923EC22_CLOTT|nr:hypothetical protein [Clostridium tetanomorphum]KAJ48935.1 hypothetical protein CTM_25768 [Clostridium tetanomorphum DSM 665]KAJ52990.1 hypothetical protein CTM_05033 [Clostridium tetanomorphum DSM 665]MBC2398521.1 hypothetical protein [Clostridium tetanomorphum]MBP1864931.1 hypothetical protein [Clostridium tetanomorphum]NRS83137.1 hypothetical protein [Clostridium tetanomorphum]